MAIEDILQVPSEIRSQDVHSKEFTWSPAMYRTVDIPNPNVTPIRELLVPDHPYDRGKEPGSIWYARQSNKFLIRTKALQDYSYLIYPKGDAIIPINPRAFVEQRLADGDIVMSKDSNVGSCAMVHGDCWNNYMVSGGILRLHPSIDRYYFFSFLKHPIFKSQLLARVPRGATISHAKSLWLECLIPFPDTTDSHSVMSAISKVMQAIIEKEVAIREKNSSIDITIENELTNNQKGGTRKYSSNSATLGELQRLGRLDAALYSKEFRDKQALIQNYEGGSATYEELGFEVRRGQNLQVSCIGKSIYSERAKPNFYRLAAPSDLSEYRTIRAFRYLGNRKSLDVLKKGDVIFGAEGFCKGRSVILADEVQRTITNIHGIVFHSNDGDIIKGIFLGCFLGYLRNEGIVDAIGAGGSGGSLAIGYFHLVLFPKFPRNIQENIASLYHSAAPPPDTPCSLDNFVEWHREWNRGLGIWELEKELKNLERILSVLQQSVIQGESELVLSSKIAEMLTT